jgi:predicted nucleic acid-binding protein
MNYLILDTSVFIKLNGTKVSSQVADVLKRHDDAEIFISEMTCFEFVRGCNNLNEIKKAVDLLSIAERLPVDSDMLKYAAYYYNVLSKLTKDDGTKKSCHPKHLSDSDIIIGATAVRLNAKLCTTNGNDFPRPLFTEISADPIGKDGLEKLFVLQADKNLFDKQISKLIK